MKKNVHFLFYKSGLRNLFFIAVLFIAGSFPLSAQNSDSEEFDVPHKMLPPPFHRPPEDIMNLNGRKMQRHNGDFRIIGVKTDLSEDVLNISVFFNDSVDTDSVSERNIILDGRPLPQFSEILFNKRRGMMRFSVKNELSENKTQFSLKIIGISSFDGRKLVPFETDKLEANVFLKIHRKDGKSEKMEAPWQKSL